MRLTLPCIIVVLVAGCGGGAEATGFTESDPPIDASAADAATVDDAAPEVDPTLDAPSGPRCGDGVLDPGEACDDGNESRFDGCLPGCHAVTPLAPPPGVWTYFPIDGATCLNGSPAGFGVSTNPSSRDLMIYLEGGGACFNDTCDFTAFNVPFVPPPDGIFNRLNPLNPVRDWNMIYVPYCTGDIHAGDHDATLGGQLRHFHGYSNITKYLETWVPSFASVTRLLVTGISAGGFGAGMNAVQIGDAFGPSRDLYMIDDSGPPLSNKVIPPCLQKIFVDTWGLDHTVLAECGADCSDPHDFARGWAEHLKKRFAGKAHAGIYSNSQDLVIRTFMGFGWGDGMYDNCAGNASPAPGPAYESDLLDLRQRYGSLFSTYYVGTLRVLNGSGLSHTVLRSPSYYTTILDGVSVPQWVGMVLEGKVAQVGP